MHCTTPRKCPLVSKLNLWRCFMHNSSPGLMELFADFTSGFQGTIPPTWGYGLLQSSYTLSIPGASCGRFYGVKDRSNRAVAGGAFWTDP